MRLIRITTNYLSYLGNFYLRYPDLSAETFIQQHQEINQDCFGWSDFWTRALEKIGYEVWEIIANAEYMQKAWATENNLEITDQFWLQEIITAQIKLFQPDILFVDDYVTFSRELIENIRQKCTSIKLVLGWCGAPYNDESIFHSYDIVLSNINELVGQFRQQGHHSEHINHAFSPHVLDEIDKRNKPEVDFSFLGSIFKHKSAHLKREKLIKELITRTNLQIWSDVSQPSRIQLLSLPIRQFIYDTVRVTSRSSLAKKIISKIPKLRHYPNLPNRPSLSDYIDPTIASVANPPLYGLSMFQKLADSKMTFNNHIDLSGKSASNMRMFEATGVGTCLVTDWKENISDLFEPERELVTYKCADECVEKVNWLLEHPQERETIAKAGQARTLKDHTFDQRAIQLNNIIQKHFNSV
jgi:spore maturation protein CgeB